MKFLRKLILIEILALIACTAWGKDSFTLRGTITDKADGSPVGMSTVLLREPGLWALSDDKGQFEIKDIPAGDSIGYNRHGRAEKDMRIGIIPIGYADGLSRLLGNGNGKFYINGQQVKVIGDICMDMCMLDLTDVEAQEGDTVVIFDAEHSIFDIAKACQTIPYEIMTSISQRVKRIYYS